MCLYPRIIKNPKYKENKKNGGVIPSFLDNRVLYVPIGCGGCIECAKDRARNWKVRLNEDVKVNTNGKFITLTFSNQSYKELYKECSEKYSGYQLDNEIATLGVRRFLERWRKKYKKSVRHWLITELGHNGTENIHLHGIIWTEDVFEIERIWKYGYVWKGKMKNEKLINYVNSKTVNYMIKYMTKVDIKHKMYKSKILSSGGIGSNYTNTYNSSKNKYEENNTKEYYINENGYKMKLPIYYRNKIYSDEEKEKLWIEKLDKHKRYVLGKEIDVKDSMEKYWRSVNEARIKNNILGYSKGWNDKDKLEYENKIREIKQIERIKVKASPFANAGG